MGTTTVAKGLRRWDGSSWADWLVPLVASTVWSAVLSGARTVEDARAIVFVGGPLVLLSGLHARLTGYLHARSRSELLPLPVDAREHWRAARPRHRRGMAATFAFGVAATLVAARVGTADDTTSLTLALGGDWLWLCLMALLVEPVVPASSSWLGRRFPEDNPWHRLQHGAGGGWTRPEAVVHLYAPALGVGVAALLALPGQLTWARLLSGAPVSQALQTAALVPLGLGLVLRIPALHVYGRGLWQAVPWLREATRTLAGPPLPERAPAWVRWFRAPVRRLLVLELLRTTPLPLLRLLALAAWTAALVLRSRAPSVPDLGIFAALLGLWLVPTAGLLAGRAARARFMGALPLSRAQRRGGLGPLGVVALGPPALLAAIVLVRWGLWP